MTLTGIAVLYSACSLASLYEIERSLKQTKVKLRKATLNVE